MKIIIIFVFPFFSKNTLSSIKTHNEPNNIHIKIFTSFEVCSKKLLCYGFFRKLFFVDQNKEKKRISARALCQPLLRIGLVAFWLESNTS